MNRPAAALELTEGQQATLQSLAKSKTAPRRDVVPAQALLLAADGVANTRIATQVGLSTMTVREWRSPFVATA